MSIVPSIVSASFVEDGRFRYPGYSIKPTVRFETTAIAVLGIDFVAEFEKNLSLGLIPFRGSPHDNNRSNVGVKTNAVSSFFYNEANQDRILQYISNLQSVQQKPRHASGKAGFEDLW